VLGVVNMMDKKWVKAHERFARGLELLRWGRDRWDQGPYEDKAPIFERKPAIKHSNAISRLWLYSYMQVGYSVLSAVPLADALRTGPCSRARLCHSARVVLGMCSGTGERAGRLLARAHSESGNREHG
jgi:hypothetical protein